MCSKLEYGSVMWDPYQQGDIDKLERVQRCATRFITKNYKSRQDGYVLAMLDKLRPPHLTREATPPEIDVPVQGSGLARTGYQY
ncbi:hypothetical protein DPMN_106723 [Dreissena polymorpha]|uniref:Uncharacterized protein n=1 Tax=Dreissena polymorpha TaxID=45954 RepID=A0A9D4QIX3_DREPO|nr:hypothetical protein DPMN_106723 [Dreissena polymorpha]